MARHRLAWVGAVVAATALSAVTTGCGDAQTGSTTGRDAGSGALGDLANASFVSTRVTSGGEERPLVRGTRISLQFWDSRLSAQAGCNTLGGDAAFRDGVIEVAGGLMTTEMGCAARLMRQDNWLARLLGGRPTATLADDRLTLTSGDTVVEFLNKETADPDRPLTGTLWTLETVSGSSPDSSAASVPSGVVSTLELDDSGRVSIRPGCNTGSGQATVSDNVIEFGPIALTRMACRGPAMATERSVMAVLDGAVQYTIDADTLTLAHGGRVLVYRTR
jgi:heat shock protein HslJ